MINQIGHIGSRDYMIRFRACCKMFKLWKSHFGIVWSGHRRHSFSILCLNTNLDKLANDFVGEGYLENEKEHLTLVKMLKFILEESFWYPQTLLFCAHKQYDI